MSTHTLWMREPPQTWPSSAVHRLTCQGHCPSRASWPPTIFPVSREWPHTAEGHSQAASPSCVPPFPTTPFIPCPGLFPWETLGHSLPEGNISPRPPEKQEFSQWALVNTLTTGQNTTNKQPNASPNWGNSYLHQHPPRFQSITEEEAERMLNGE